MHIQTMTDVERQVQTSSDEELINTLIAISVVSKCLARKLQALSDQKNAKGGKSNGKNE